MNGLAAWLRRWHAFVLLLPLQVLLTVAGFVLLGALDRRLAIDNPFAFLLELPALCGYAAAAVGFATAVKHLLLYDIARCDEVAVHDAARNGDAGARWLLLKDRLEWLALLLLFCVFFFPSR